MKIASLMFIFFAMSCSAWSQTDPKNANKTQRRLRSDGIYSTYDTSVMSCGDRVNNHYHTYNHLNVINASCIIFNNGVGSRGNHFLKIKSYEDKVSVCGKYTITGDAVHAIDVPIALMAWGGRIKLYYANFKGTIKNADTISDWKMIPPYPKANKRLNDNFKFETTPKLLYFIESKELLGLDSLYQKKVSGK